MPRIINLAIGTPKEYNWNHEAKLSGIGKTSTKVAELKKVGLVEEVGNKEKHGGVDRAVCLYPFEHYSYWKKSYERKWFYQPLEKILQQWAWLKNKFV